MVVSGLGVDANKSDMAPANQSRFSALLGPPQEFCTERVRAGQVERVRAMERSNFCWIFSVGVSYALLRWEEWGGAVRGARRVVG